MKHAVQRIHFVGIGGVGMSGIAEILHNLGYRVSGSDAQASATTQRLAGLGLRIAIGHEAAHLGDAQVVVTSSAVAAHNPEVVAARRARLPVVPRAVMLAELMRLKSGIAIAGTHGKTTTTSLVTSVLAAAGLDPTFVIGGKLNSAGVNSRLGSGEHIVVEADESDASFLNLSPVLSVVTNIDADHMDTYGHDFARLKAAFVDFIHRLPFYGAAVLCVDDAGVRSVLPMVSRPIISTGLAEGAMVRAVNVQPLPGGQMRFDCLREGRAPLPLLLNLAGEHNVRNALAAVAVAQQLGIGDDALAQALAQFSGVGRRFQHFGELPLGHGAAGAAGAASAGRADGADSANGPGVRHRPGHFTLIDDYGHHPAEMAAVLAAARGAYPGQRLVLAFQPHRYTRTRDCFEDFVAVMGEADAVLLAEVYAAGEAPIAAADGRALARALRLAGKVEPVFVDEIGGMAQAILHHARAGDVCITMGAGSIGTVPAQLLALALPAQPAQCAQSAQGSQRGTDA
jgi:UDP-N-acetylmuramate--alanine ligase